MLSTGYVTVRGKWPLLEEFVAGFGDKIQQKRILDTDQLFPSSQV